LTYDRAHPTWGWGTMRRMGFVVRTIAVGSVALSVAPAASASARTGYQGRGADRGAPAEPRFGASPAVSAGGRYIAFTSSADDLVAGDGNGSPDVFVRDRGTGRTERVSVGAGGTEAQPSRLGSGQPAISGDGRYVAFTSAASNLVAADTNREPDVFVRDRVGATTVRASVASDGVQARGSSGLPAISADGRVVAFVSEAPNVVRGDSNRALDVFVRDLAAGTTARVSVSSSGAQARGPVRPRSGYQPALSADGAIVAFASPSSGLVPGDRNRADDVFVRDRAARTTSLVSVDSAGAQRRLAGSRAPSLSGDGRFVAFDSAAGFDGADANRASDVYVRDRQAATTSWASPATDARGSDAPALSGDGRYVLFDSRSQLLPGDTDGFSDVYRYDRTTATTTLASIDTWYGRAGAGPASQPSSSQSGLVVAFTSAGGLVPDDSDPAPDVLEQVLDATRPSISFLGLVAPKGLDVNAPQPAVSDVPTSGQLVYRVWGGGTRQFGASWTPVPPDGLGPDRYRYSTGLPDRLNAGTNVTFGALDAASSVVLVRPALPLNPNDDFGIPDFLNTGVTYRSYTGGVIEYIIPGADAHVLNPQTRAVAPAFGGVPPGCVPAPRGCVGDQGP
jgi:Tol biopolymer transport system component